MHIIYIYIYIYIYIRSIFVYVTLSLSARHLNLTYIDRPFKEYKYKTQVVKIHFLHQSK